MTLTRSRIEPRSGQADRSKEEDNQPIERREGDARPPGALEVGGTSDKAQFLIEGQTLVGGAATERGCSAGQDTESDKLEQDNHGKVRRMRGVATGIRWTGCPIQTSAMLGYGISAGVGVRSSFRGHLLMFVDRSPRKRGYNSPIRG